MAVISLIDAERQWFLSRHGVEDIQTARRDSVCSDVVAAQRPLVVSDLSQEPRYADLPGVQGSTGHRAYAGTPLIGRDGLPLGVLCVMDTSARSFTEDQLAALDDLANQVITTLELQRCDATNGLTSRALVHEARQPVALRRALGNHEFVPYYQPVVDMRDGSIVGLEALVRWEHPTHGLLLPGAFLPGLETGTLALWTAQAVLEAACTMMVDLHLRGSALSRGVAVNISGHQMGLSGLGQRLLARLARHSLPAGQLTVEITESAEITDLALAHRELMVLRTAGVKVVIDDFGVGWSNLTRLLQLPVTGLKIDRELITHMLGDRVREHMVASALALAVAMDLDIVAEGVETEAVRERLLGLGCRYGQGWLFSKAVAANELDGLLGSNRGARAGRCAR